ncbi:MAG: penicillin acylase family protein [Sphingobacteriaceae bacterium]
MKALKSLFTLLLTVALTFSLNHKWGSIPPLGKFLDPFQGFWKNAESRTTPAERKLQLDGLQAEVSIQFDDQRIPHIFAENEHDLYYTQGYITAKDRLWQMDFQTRFAAGRLSEVIGPKALELDRYQRRMGMGFGAENMTKTMMSDPEIANMMNAYAAGVNAYIKTLKPGDYPIEFKILDYQPEEWTPLNSALLLKLMSATLAGGSNEFYMSNILKKYGADVVKDLFPDYPYREDPIIPVGTKWNFKAERTPDAPLDANIASSAKIETKQKEEGIGSNNWALSGSKTSTGSPMLANDPHLDLTLPAIWYQVQLISGNMNVCGVSIPGAPGVIIGFNQKVAWGVTNVGSDVLDWYQVQFKDNSHQAYRYNNEWKPTKTRIEKIEVRGGQTVNDTVYYTHQGPVVYLQNQKPANFAKASNIPEGYALRWVAHDPSNDVRTFYMLNKANNYDDYRKALTYFTAPAQNFLFASMDNDIAITPNGYFPLKWKNQGKFLLDGTNPANDWHGRIPAEQNPTVKNPPRGFASSANQFSTDPTYPYYLNWEFSGYERAHRINNRLTVMTKATVDSLRNLQNDNYSIFAENVLSTFVGGVNATKLNAEEKKAFAVVSKWNKFYNADEIGASLFEIWQKELAKEIWDDEFGDPNTPMRYPSRDKTVQMLLSDPDAKWFDNVKTPQKETKNDLLLSAFRFSVDSLTRAYGPQSDKWQWANVKHTHVPHLAKIGGFGSKTLFTGGSKTSVNATSESNGPSWRMIVSLGKDLKAYGLYPGGESGNPGSFYYDDMIEGWASGKLNELVYLRSKTQSSERIISTWKITKK